MPAVPSRIPFAFRLAGYAGLERGRGSAGAVWVEAVLPVAPGEGSRQYRSELTKASAKSNEPKGLKVLVINKIAHKTEKQTQANYEP